MDSGKKYRVRSRKLEVLSSHGARPHMGPAQKRTRPSGSGPAAALPQALRLQPPGPPKAAAGSPTPSPPDAASEPERPGRGGPNGGSPPANRRRKPARSPPPPPRRSPRARGGAYLTAGQAPPIAPPGGRCVPAAPCGPRPQPPSLLPINLWCAPRGAPPGPEAGHTSRAAQ